VHGRRGTLARETAVRESPILVVAEIQEIGGRPGDVNTVLGLATAIEFDWLKEAFPTDVSSDLRVAFDSASRRVYADQIVRFRDLDLESKRIEPPPADAAAQLLADEVVSGRLQLPKWDHGVEQWILRLNLLAQWCPDLALPSIEEEDRKHIIEQLCLGSVGYKDIKDREVKPVVKSWLSEVQRELLDKYAPERVKLSNGRTPKVVYEENSPPYISLRIQELFGVTQTPRIAMDRVPLSVHVLAPSMRPVQVTQDLASFWREHYPRIKSELQGKYPKHEWR
jgi:ATP-dependent helicase HrpB